MATIEQVQKGFVRLVDNHISVAFDGWQRAVVSGCAGLLAANLPKIMKTYADNPIVASLGVYDPERGTVDIDALYNAFVPKLGSDKLPISVPSLGTIKLGREEFDALRQYIKEA